MNYACSSSSISKLNQYLKGKWDHLMPPTSYFHGKLIRWRSLSMLQKMIHRRYILLEHLRISDAVLRSCTKRSGRKIFFLYKTDNSMLGNIMLKDLLGDLTILAAHCHAILILKTDLCNAFIGILPRRMTASWLISRWFIWYLCIFIHWDYYSDIWLLTNFKSSYQYS